ncbi:MAG TPA: hypothetical protein VFX70_15580 [Mycobacteriales bacterium]|nr:hypothetical protein [Mycobacteriales bacterium]
MIPPIDVEPEQYSAASAVFGQDMAGGLSRAWSALTGGLQGCAAMAGSDPGGTAWAAQYDPAAAATVGMITDLANACTQIAALLEQTGFNHGMAESASDPTRGVPTPPDRTSYVVPTNNNMVCIPGHDVPLAAGGSGSAPHGWGIVQHAVGYVWPDGDPEKLRKAATAWGRAASALDAVASFVPEALEAIRAQRSPEVNDAVTVCSSMGDHISAAADECRALASACTQLAGHIDQAHHDIEHELVSLLEWTVGIEAGGAILGAITFGSADVGAQAVEAGRIAVTAAKIAEIIRTLVAAARTVAETVSGVLGRVGRIAARLRPVLGARLSQVTTKLASRLPRLGKDAESAAARKLEAAVVRSLDNPASLRGATPDEVRDLIPDGWIEKPLKKGSGVRFLNPKRPGESVSIEDGWPGHSDPLHSGPYVKISRNGIIERIPLHGNPVLGE